MVEPHQQTGKQKQQAAQRDGQEVKLLTTVEESHLCRLQLVLMACVLLDVFEPARIAISPKHWRQPIEKLEEEKDVEGKTKPWMQQTSRGAAAKDWRQESE